MIWIDDEVQLSSDAGWFIVQGMREVARADGLYEAGDLHLLDALEAEFPTTARGATVASLASTPSHNAYLRALLMVAIADGQITEGEREVVVRLAAGIGLSAMDVAQRIIDMRRYFDREDVGVQIFQIAVLQLAEDAGLSEAAMDRLSAATEMV